MGQDPIIYEGITLMALGMSFVFSFLCLLVGAIRVLTKASSYFLPKQQSEPKPISQTVNSDDNVIAAISAALHHHKQNQKIQTN